MTRTNEHVTEKFRALRERAGLSLAALAKAMGYRNSSSLQRYENSDLYTKEFISAEIAQKLAIAVVGKGAPPITEEEIWALAHPQKLAQNPKLVASYDPDAREATAPSSIGYTRDHWKPKAEGAIPEIDGRLGAGNGQIGEVINIAVGKDTIAGHKVVDEWQIPLSFLHNEAKASAGNAIVMEVVGDSMQPSYHPGDRVIVDLSATEFTTDTVYAISDGESEPQIKRLQRVPFSEPTQVRIISDNPALETFTVDLSRLTVIGRICGHLARR